MGGEDMSDSDDTTRANIALRIALKNAICIDTKSAVLLQEAIEFLIESKIADSFEALADRVERQ